MELASILLTASGYRILTLCIALTAFTTTPCLGIELGSFLADNVVLAREPLEARLWGWSDEVGETISVSIDGEEIGEASTTVQDDGAWVINLPPREASAGPHTLTILGSRSTTGTSASAVTLKNVAFGDVFLCSGQSNMEFAVAGAFNSDAEIADSINYPNLRLANVNKTIADDPQDRVGSKSPYVWAVSAPDAFGASWQWPSAACYFFGRDLYRMLDEKVPIGLVSAPWGGQSVTAFSSPDAMSDSTCGGTIDSTDIYANKYHMELENIGAKMKGAVEESTAMFRRQRRRLPETSQLWNAMIHPLLNARFAAALWYQGESDAGDPTFYACHFPAMIVDWRRKFDLRLPFYFVQLAAHTTDFSLIREAQMAALKLDDVSYAVAIDIGDPTSPWGAIHPRRKQEVGRRLALAVLGGPLYGRDVITSGPLVRGAIVNKETSSIIVTFVPGTECHLHANGTAACDENECCNTSPFEVHSSTKGNWTRADFTVLGNRRVLLSVPEGIIPSEVRYDWEGYPQCAIYNGVGGPDDHHGIAATPFHIAVVH
eukprot:CAMPEP_0197720292 /NCGR_PEP_ID=MMETSP1434-20131217/3704_1 /TAXON_ID=265543 /ORGANISM="Minutocellus polymorphus, Strain CCMP3303" /LENGTH=543 /DNA_ID=CAMNT_0043305137 /DNA_START=238 /DNA_END=1869 /DNA_ORIENTATION=+